MRRPVPTVTLALTLLFTCPLARAADKKGDRRDRQRKGDARAVDSSPAAAEGTTYEQELAAARDDRDRQLDDAGRQEGDRDKLERRKTEIFSQYARIVAALRDKYEQREAKAPPTTEPAGPDAASTKRAGRDRGRQTPQDFDPSPGKSYRGKAGDKEAVARPSSEDAQRAIDEEDARHQAKLDELNGQLKEADTANNRKEVRRLEKAIEKENNTYEAKKSVLERRLRDAGGAPAR